MMSSNNTVSAVANNRSHDQGRQTLEVLMEPIWLLIIRLTIECLIALAGVIGNIVVCYAITKHRILSAAATNTYIRNVAVSDLATLLISFPLIVVRERLPYWPLGEVVCRFFFPSIDIFFGVSVWTVAAIAIDKHRTLTADVPRLAVTRSLSKPRLVCASIWLLSFLIISLPLILVFEHREFPDNKPKCVANWGQENYWLQIGYHISVCLVTYVLPLSVIVITYFTIKRKLYKSQSFHLEMAKSSFGNYSFKMIQINLVKRRSKRLKTIMTPVVAVFAVTILPLTLLRVVPRFFSVKSSMIYLKYSNIIFNVCVFLYICNAACNPLIYSIISKRFRTSFRELLTWRS